MYKKIIYLAFLATVIFGCKKAPSGLVLPVDELNSENYPKSISDLQTILAPGYSNLRSFALYGRQYLPLVLSNDHTFCSTVLGNTFLKPGGEFLTNNVDPNNNPNAQFFSYLYQGVSD